MDAVGRRADRNVVGRRGRGGRGHRHRWTLLDVAWMSWASRSSLEGVVDDADACGMWLDVPDSMRGVVYLVGRCGRRARASTTLLDVPSRGRRWTPFDVPVVPLDVAGRHGHHWMAFAHCREQSLVDVMGGGRWVVGKVHVGFVEGVANAITRPRHLNASTRRELWNSTSRAFHRQLKRDGVHSLTRGTTVSDCLKSQDTIFRSSPKNFGDDYF